MSWLDDLQATDLAHLIRAGLLAPAGWARGPFDRRATRSLPLYRTGERAWPDDGPCWGETPEERLIDTAVSTSSLPWPGIGSGGYLPGRSVADVERAAGRLPHLRLDQAADESRAGESSDG